MGVDFSHGDARWSYSGFQAFRRRLAAEIGIESLTAMEGYDGDEPWTPYESDVIVKLLNHSDCDGDLPPEHLPAIAARLRELVSAWPDDQYDKQQAIYLAEGMEMAATDDEPLTFL